MRNTRKKLKYIEYRQIVNIYTNTVDNQILTKSLKSQMIKGKYIATNKILFITIKYYVIRYAVCYIAARHKYMIFLWRFIKNSACVHTTQALGYNCSDFILGSSY